jgi:hypothetical protein
MFPLQIYEHLYRYLGLSFLPSFLKVHKRIHIIIKVNKRVVCDQVVLVIQSHPNDFRLDLGE